MVDEKLVERLIELLFAFVHKEQRMIVFEIMHLLNLILQEGILLLLFSYLLSIDYSAGSHFLTPSYWTKLTILTNYITNSDVITSTTHEKEVEQSVTMSFLTTIIQSAIVCIADLHNKCWCVYSKELCNFFIRSSSASQLTLIKQYLSIFSLFSKIGIFVV